MRVKLTGITFGVVVAGVLTFSSLGQLNEDGRLNVTTVLGVIILGLATTVLTAWLYVVINRLLHRKGYSLHDDEDFEE